tara:strand:+ start:2235 stop:2738 length:504 start_codon:yes stop_codon:yes gene_type:complete
MKNLSIILVLVLGVVFASCSKEDVIDQAIEITLPDLSLANETDLILANQILEKLNNYRAAVGLTSFSMGGILSTALAVQHCDYMIQEEKISHDHFVNRARVLKKAESAVTVGENVAAGYESAESVVNAWLNSPSHREAIEGNYTQAGIGIKTNKSNRKFYTLLLFKL